MKKRFFVIPAVFLLYCSCYKLTNTKDTSTPAFNIFTENNGAVNDSIVTLKCNDSIVFNLNLVFDLISGDPENFPITCSLGNLPAGITDTPASITFKLKNRISFALSVNTDTGTYTFNLNVTTPGGAKAYPMRLHVLPVFDEAQGLAGIYTGSDPCGHYSIGDIWYSYTATVATVQGHPHLLSIKNYRGLGDSIVVYATVAGGSVDIPVQTTNGYTFFSTGKGYYSTDGKPWISIYGDTIVHAGDTQTCYMQLKQ